MRFAAVEPGAAQPANACWNKQFETLIRLRFVGG
jgi:hypothetical protein